MGSGNGCSCNGQQIVTAGEFAPEALLGAIIEMSDDAIFTCDVSGKIVTWSITAERLFGRSADEVMDGPLADLFPSHLTEEVQIVIAAALAGDRIRHFETEALRPDGMPQPVSISLCPVLDEGGSSVGSVVVVRDVTEQHLAQATLAEVDARMVEGEILAHIGSWLWDLRTGTVQWSAEFHRIHGVDPVEFDGTFESYLALVHPDDRDLLRAAMVESVDSGRPFNREYRVIGSQGGEHVVQVRAQPTFGSAGTAVGLRGIGQDVTARIINPVNRDQPGS
jgi:two-component system, sensor histidine kinase and response regulator